MGILQFVWWPVGFEIWFGWLVWLSSLFIWKSPRSRGQGVLLHASIHKGWELRHPLTVQALWGQVGKKISLWRAFKLDTKSLTLMSWSQGSLKSESKRTGWTDSGQLIGKEYDLSNCILKVGLQEKKNQNQNKKPCTPPHPKQNKTKQKKERKKKENEIKH